MNNIKDIVAGVCYGIKDSLLGIAVLANVDDGSNERPPGRRGTRSSSEKNSSGKKKKAKVLPMFTQCCLLNGGVLLLSVMIFDNYLIPGMKMLMAFIAGFVLKSGKEESSASFWLEGVMKYTFQYLWVVPLFWLCKILNCIWFVEIADAAYRKKLGRPVLSLLSSKDSIFKVISKTTADLLFSIQVETLFLIQAQIVGLLPIFGSSLAFFHMCLLYSLYAFEYTWTNLGWSVVKRLSFIETNWPYFLGYGVILTVVTNISSSTVISACIFGITFPVFILSGLDAKPCGYCEYPVRLFSPVIWLTNKLFLFNSKKYPSNTKDTSSG